ncbi:MAG: type II secretion system protein [Opitutales bacterium]|nr:type II secretion system protein [Opitutales bacterium]
MKSSPKSYNFFSIKEFALVIAIVAAFVAIVVPSSYFIRSSVRAKKIEEQLAAISKAGRDYIYEKGGSSVSYKKLLLEGKIKPQTKFYGESYEDIVVYSSGGFLTVTMGNGDEIKVKY